jgi:hypothetical protein
MTTQQSERTNSDATIKRRGLFALAAATIAGLVAKLTEEPLSAGTDGDVVLGDAFGANVSGTSTAVCQNSFVNNGPAIHGFRSPGAIGSVTLTINAGVMGQTFVADSPAIWGRSQNGTQAKGVHGISFPGYGVLGETTSGVGVQGAVMASSNANAIAVYGLNNSSYAGPGPGAGGFGVYGLSIKGHGLVGATASAGAAAVVGATNGVDGAYAAAFYGPVIVGGPFTVVGGAKSAAVPHPDGSHRRLYCMESPESWFEDFGQARLECGAADVMIDPDFAAVVDTKDYQVFLTEYDRHSDLCVVDRTPTGFRVESKDAAADAPFGWRVVAKRSDIRAERFAPVTIPPEPTLPPPLPEGERQAPAQTH